MPLYFFWEFVDCFVALSSCSEDDILKELEELSLEAQGGKAKVSAPSENGLV